MFRANVYSYQPLPVETDLAIRAGIIMVANVMEEEVEIRDRAMKFTNAGDRQRLNPYKCIPKTLDRMVELHLIALPYKASMLEEVGLGYYGDGVAFTDNSISGEGQTLVTAHEVSHGFGFVRAEAPNADKKSHTHCRDAHCIMYKKVAFLENGMPFSNTALTRVRSGRAHRTTANLGVHAQHEFCPDCTTDMKTHGQQKIKALRYNRIFRPQPYFIPK